MKKRNRGASAGTKPAPAQASPTATESSSPAISAAAPSFWHSAPLPHLETFAMAAQLGSFTAAAVQMGVTQVAVSKRIAQLERELGVSLFERHARHVELTRSGRELYQRAQQIMQLHQEAREVVAGERLTVGGELHIAASSVPGEHLLPSLLAGFHERFPGVQVKAAISDSGAVIRDVLRGASTLGLVGRQPEQAELEVRPLGDDALVLIAPPTGAWRDRRELGIDELRGLPLVVREEESGSRWRLQQALETVGLAWSDLKVVVELGSNASLIDAVRRGLGAGFVSRLAVERELTEGSLIEIATPGLPLQRRLYLIFDRRRPLPAPAQAFLAFVAAQGAQPSP